MLTVLLTTSMTLHTLDKEYSEGLITDPKTLTKDARGKDGKRGYKGRREEEKGEDGRRVWKKEVDSWDIEK